ncbi:MAG: hypothetical protein ALECFALPRED_011141 [Alectoria fallacina]|uniref:Uncharacterized protein n=1 Tax=Alectoria fallacina TaxID=1903189 RepID=A0A8H3J9N0_9LECA|nr:MAG: hypothetical protein ALECFALPRED_011141 [Alectoria fallacina]
MGAEPPFLYDHPSKFSFSGPTQQAFNPKAATHASLSLPTPTSKPDGPLINAKEYNRHPDSYYVAPYGNLDWKPMGPHTKSRVKWTRITQLVLRTCELIGAVGMLFCVICIKGTDATTGWIIRVPSIEPVNAPSHWSTLLGSDEATTSIVFAIFITSVVTGTLHLVSLATSIYLGVMFRKISRLPPDMNPLEDNLTSRHKRNKSSLLDNRMSQISTPTDKLRVAKAEDPLMASPTLPFMHTRNDSYSDVTILSHPNASASASCTNLSTPFYDQPPAHRSPHYETSPFEYTTNSENFRPLEMNPPTPPLNQQKRRRGARVEQRALTPGTGNLGQGGGWAPGMVGIGKAKARGGMGRSGLAGKGGGGRVVSRSGVEVKERGIFPSGGIRAREVSGKVMEEGRTGVGGRM